MPKQPFEFVESDVDAGIPEFTTQQQDYAQQQALEEEREATSFGDLYDAAQNLDWTTNTLSRRNHLNSYKVDPDWTLTPEKWEELTDGINPEFWDTYELAVSEESAQWLRDQLQEQQKQESMLAKNGLTGFTARLGANMSDPGALALGLLSAPISTSAKAGRMANAFRNAGMVGAENMAIETALKEGTFTKDWNDVLMAGFAGALIGGPLGATAPHRTGLEDEAEAAIARTAQRGLDEMEGRIVSDAEQEVETQLAEEAADPRVALRSEARQLRDEKRTVLRDIEKTDSARARNAGDIARLYEELERARGVSLADELSVREEAMKWLNRYTARIEGNKKNPQKYPASSIPDPDELEGRVRDVVADYLDDPKALRREVAELRDDIAAGGDEVDAADLDRVAKLQDEIEKRRKTESKLVRKMEKLERWLASNQKRLSAFAKKSRETLEQVRKQAEEAGGRAAAGADQLHPYNKPTEIDPDVGDVFTPDQKNYSRTAFAKGRYSIAAQGGRSKNPIQRWLTGNMVLDAVGREGHEVTEHAASEEAHRLAAVYRVALYRALTPRFKEWAKANRISFFKNPNAFMRARRSFHEQVTATVRGAKTDDPQVRAAANDISDLYAKILEDIQESGVRGFEDIPENINYAPRLFDWLQVRQMADTYGDQVELLIQKAIKRANPDLDDDYVRILARGYWQQLSKLESGVDQLFRNPLNKENRDILRNILLEYRGQGGKELSADEVDEIMQALKKDAPEAGTDSARAKQRVLMDENTTMYLTNRRTGEVEPVNVNRLFQNDIEQLSLGYIRQMAGRIALAKKDPNIFASESSFRQFLNRMRKYGRDREGMTREELDADEENAMFMWKYITGQPMEENISGNYAKFARLLSDWNFVRVMNQVGWAQMAEIGNIIGIGGFRQMVRHIPAMGKVMTRAKDGHLEDELQEELELFLGTGSDWLINPATARYDDYGYGAGGLDTALGKYHEAMQYAKRGTAAISMMAPVNTFLHRLTSRVVAQRFLDAAQGTSKIDPERLRALGLDDETWEVIQEQLKKHSTTTEGTFFKTARVRKLNLDQWDAGTLGARDAFVNAASRMARRIIQENDPGTSAKWMHTTTGRLIMQFRTFMSGAYEKQLLHNVHMGIHTIPTLTAFAMSSLFGALAYTGQTYSNAIGNPDAKRYLQDRLDPMEVAKAAVYRAGWSSWIPSTLDTGLYLTGFDPQFSHARTTQMSASLIQGIPTVDLGMKAVEAARGAGGALVNPEYQYSQQDWRNLTGIAWFSNALMLKQAFANMGESLPKYSLPRE